MNYLMSEDGTVFTEVNVRGLGERAGTTAYTFVDGAPHVYAAPTWRIGPDKQELRRLVSLTRCEALERMAVDLQRQATVLIQHACDLRQYLEHKA